ncbi:hypothetical protein [Nocardia sp. CY41]|uniref:hypothetical protein n=1 Tax=Nocardia sp. CY41 TaxID=2608686 RepID=UPI002E2BC67A|nr:hypothetical protein [Nocardia sp. CY41]
MDALTFLRNDHESVLGMIELFERGRGDGAAEIRAFGSRDESGDRRIPTRSGGRAILLAGGAAGASRR